MRFIIFEKAELGKSSLYSMDAPRFSPSEAVSVTGHPGCERVRVRRESYSSGTRLALLQVRENSK
jgi:hypothetical protein